MEFELLSECRTLWCRCQRSLRTNVAWQMSQFQVSLLLSRSRSEARDVSQSGLSPASSSVKESRTCGSVRAASSVLFWRRPCRNQHGHICELFLSAGSLVVIGHGLLGCLPYRPALSLPAKETKMGGVWGRLGALGVWGLHESLSCSDSTLLSGDPPSLRLILEAA